MLRSAADTGVRICLIRGHIMRKISAKLIVSLTVLLFMAPTYVWAQKVSQTRKWIAQNPKYIQFSSGGIHFLLRDAKEGSDSVKTTFHLPAGQPWKIAFDVQMVPTSNGGMSVHLTQAATDLGWMGAGDYYKYISGFLGTGNGNMPFNQPWDNNWHSFSYQSDGKILSLWHNASKCGETTLEGTPDTLTLQSTGIEVRVRNVEVMENKNEDVRIRKAPEASFIKRNLQKPKVVAKQILHFPELQHQIDDFNDLLIFAQEANHNIKTYANVTSQDLELMSKAQPGDLNNLNQDFADALKLMNEQFDKQKISLRKAMTLRDVILTNPNFASGYHETRVCLPPEEITTDMPKARDLRFIEKRN